MSSNDKTILESTINNVMQSTNVEAVTKLAESENTYEIKGYDLNKGLDYNKILESYLQTGFQATNFARAVNEVNRMVIYK